KLEPPPQRLQPGKSVGSPTEGHLVGGSPLADAPPLRIHPVYAQGDVRWGIEPLVGAIDRAARAVRKQFPDSVLSVGHLSKQGGGERDLPACPVAATPRSKAVAGSIAPRRTRAGATPTSASTSSTRRTSRSTPIISWR